MTTLPRSKPTPTLWDGPRLAAPHAQSDKAARVEAMFDSIAPTYERVNRLLSLGRDAHWRRTAVRLADLRSTDRVLDVACGTGDLSRAFARPESGVGPALVVGADFARRMVQAAAARDGSDRLRWCRADAQRLPFADESFDVVSCAFGVRNFQSLDAGLRAMRRVLAPGGRAVILEFSVPRNRVAAAAYLLYFRRVLPKAAAWISGDRTGAYHYLPESVTSFVDGEGLAEALRRAGFARVRWTPLTCGIVTVHVAWR